MITGKEVWSMMGDYGNSSWQGAWNGMWPGAMAAGTWSWVLIIPVLVVLLGLWIYTSFAYMEIARKLKYKNPWLAWIPFARGAMVLQLGNLPWGWVFLWSPLLLLPLAYLGNLALSVFVLLLVIGGSVAFTVLCYISRWRFFEKRGYYGWLALIPLVGMVLGYLSILAGLAFLIILGFVAWKDGKMVKMRNSKPSASRRNPRRKR